MEIVGVARCSMYEKRIDPVVGQFRASFVANFVINFVTMNSDPMKTQSPQSSISRKS